MTVRNELRPADIAALAAQANAGAHAAAERGARTLLELHPRAGILWKILSVALLHQGKAALPELEQAALLMPADAEAQANLGAALCEQGRWRDALPSLTRALAVEPGHRGATADAGNAFFMSGRPEEALRCYRRLLEHEPRSADLHNNIGLCLAALGRRVEALDNLAVAWRELGERRRAEGLHRRALEIEPRRPRSHYGLGSSQLERGRPAQAEASFRRVLELEPEHAAAHLGLAAALRQQRRGDEAQTICAKALALAPRSAEAVWLLGELKGDLGAFTEAQALYRRAIEIDPSFPSSFSSIAQQRRMTAADAPWRRAVESLLAKRPPLGHAIGLHFALGKYCDDVGSYDEAFHHFRAANELKKRYGAVYDADQLARRIDRLIATCDASWMATHRADGPPAPAAAQKSVFVLGMPRSGTSLVEQILASHPAVFGAGEISFWEDGFAAQDSRGWTGAAGAEALAGLAAEYLQRTAHAPAAAQRVIDKMPANFLYAGLIHAALPGARIIHVRRDPLDTCLSAYFQNFSNAAAVYTDLEHLAHYYREYVRITDHWRAVLPAAAFLEIAYEDLVADQERWTRRMLEFIDLPYDPACLEFHRAERAVITASKWQVRQPINTASVGRWRNYVRHLGPLASLDGGAIDPADADAQATADSRDAAARKGSR
jgi:tetratricopeptide (TPR) repeat protein